MRLAICDIRLSVLVHLYVRRLRAHTVQELLAGSGIAVGVALVLGVLLANASLLGSTEQTIKGVIGAARLELASRSDKGFGETLVKRVALLRGVQVAAPVLQENATVLGAKGRLPVRLIGVTPSVVSLGGSITRNVGATPSLIGESVGLPVAVAAALKAKPEQGVTLLIGGRAVNVKVSAILAKKQLAQPPRAPWSSRY